MHFLYSTTWFLNDWYSRIFAKMDFHHRIGEGETGLPIPPRIMAPSAMELKLGRVGFLPNSARKLTE